MSITCQVCATVNPDTAQFCDGCGVELTPQASPAAPAPLPAEPAQEAQLGAARVDPALPDANAQGAADLTGEAANLEGGLADMPLPTETGSTEAGASVESAAPTPEPTSEPTPEAMPAEQQAAPESTPAATEGALETAAMPSPQEIGTQPQGSDLADAAATASAATSTPSGEPRTGPARLGVRKFGAATGDFIPLAGERLVVGRFDASSGPVDIDLAAIGGAEHISRRHAELSQQGGQWTVTDLGSTNGVFIKRSGQGAFSPRLQEPTPLSDGDEVAFGNLVLTFHQD